MVAGGLAGVLAAVVLAAAGTGTAVGAPGAGAAGGGAPGAERGGGSSVDLRVVARFSPPTALLPSLALTYRTALVPAGARIEVEQHSTRRGSTVQLRVTGVRAGHGFGAHVHRAPCGADPAAAGGHYQHRVDPVQPSTDPAYANPRNEVWLDFTADAHGEGAARAHHTWGFRSGEAGSVVLHDAPGTAGARVACFTVPFGPVSAG